MAKYNSVAEYKAAMEKSENEQREALSTLVDMVHQAFHDAGGTSEEYVKTQFFQNLLFQSINQTTAGTKEREGALKLCLIFMRRLRQHYVDMRKDPEWMRSHAEK